MSSILTNNGAMIALQTLKQINSDLGKTQAMISTGKSVASSKDNSAVWAISKVMEADVKGFKAISDSLSLGESTVAVARQATESVTELLIEMKGKIVSSQESNVDRLKIQEDIQNLSKQIETVVGAAQFNGLNLLQNTSTTAGSGKVEVLSSLDRASTGAVVASDISVRKTDLGRSASELAATAGADNIADGTGDGAVAAVGAAAVLAGDADPTEPRANTLTTITTPAAAGMGFGITITASGGAIAGLDADVEDLRYVARDGDTGADIAKGLAQNLNAHFAKNGATDIMSASVQFDATTGDAQLKIVNNSKDAADTISIQIDSFADSTIGGGLEKLTSINVSSTEGAKDALAAIEGLLQHSIDAAASFGSAQGRIGIQADFVGKLTDSMRSGIGAMVDANMEEASARLQALQVQQQLGVQSLSIANQAPQSILSLFR